MFIFATKRSDVRKKPSFYPKNIGTGQPPDLLTTYVFLWTAPNQLSANLKFKSAYPAL